MKNVFFALLLAVSFASCVPEAVFPISGEGTSSEATILGRWDAGNVRVEFTDDKRFTIYGNGDGTFPTLEQFTQENPGLTGNDWWYEGEVVVVDLNFGNFSRLVPMFKCGNQVIRWVYEDGSEHSSLFREGHDITACN